MRHQARSGVAAGAVVLSLILAACGASNPTSSASSTASTAPRTSTSTSVDATHNAADVSFTQSMVVHHQGAITMAKLAAAQASTQQVKDLQDESRLLKGPRSTR
jgi:uncharacterized protein (DUF305 family)